MSDETGLRCRIGVVGSTYAEMEKRSRDQAARFFGVAATDVVVLSTTVVHECKTPPGGYAVHGPLWEMTFVYGLHTPDETDDD